MMMHTNTRALEKISRTHFHKSSIARKTNSNQLPNIIRAHTNTQIRNERRKKKDDFYSSTRRVCV